MHENTLGLDWVYGNLKLLFPIGTAAPEIADTLTRLIALTEARVIDALALTVADHA